MAECRLLQIRRVAGQDQRYGTPRRTVWKPLAVQGCEVYFVEPLQGTDDACLREVAHCGEAGRRDGLPASLSAAASLRSALEV